MCGRFFLARRALEIARALGLPLSPRAEPWRPRYNIAPTQEVLTVIGGESGPLIEPRRWGLIPHWAKDATIGSKMINARIETVASKPSFARPLRSTRCVVLADGFFEWKNTPAGKIPVALRPEKDEVIGFAGIWTTWKPPAGEPVQSCTLITREAQGPIKDIHFRMPAFLPRSEWEEWVAPREADPVAAVKRIGGFPPPDLRFIEVSKLVNNPRNDKPEVLTPV